MSKSIVFTSLGVVALAAAGIFGYLNSDARFAKSGGDEVLMFDNSKPGKWKFKTVEYTGEDNKLVNSGEAEVCAKQEQIEKSMKRALKDKLSMDKLECSTDAKRLSKNGAEFVLSCVGITPEQQSFGARVDGKIDSRKEKNTLLLNYKMAHGGEQPITIKKEITGERIGECK